MRMCAQNSLITNDRDVSDGGTFFLLSSFFFVVVSSSSSSFFFLSLFSNDGPVDHPSLDGLKADNDGSG
jgi:hypothetical protein